MGAIEQGVADGVRDLVAGAINDNCPESPAHTWQLRFGVIQELTWQTSICVLPTCIERRLLGTGRRSDTQPETTWRSPGWRAQTSPKSHHGEVSIISVAQLSAALSELVGSSRWLRLRLRCWSCRRSCDRARGRAWGSRGRSRDICRHLHALTATHPHQFTQHPAAPAIEVELPPVAGRVLAGDGEGLPGLKSADLCIVGARTTTHIDSRGGGQPGHLRRGGRGPWSAARAWLLAPRAWLSPAPRSALPSSSVAPECG